MSNEPLRISHTMKGNSFKAIWQSGTSANTKWKNY